METKICMTEEKDNVETNVTREDKRHLPFLERMQPPKEEAL
jgi:hypothetical protein